jgi:hypothetical protein
LKNEKYFSENVGKVIIEKFYQRKIEILKGILTFQKKNHLSKKGGNLSDLAETLGIDGTRVLSKHTKFGGHPTTLSGSTVVKSLIFPPDFSFRGTVHLLCTARFHSIRSEKSVSSGPKAVESGLKCF